MIPKLQPTCGECVRAFMISLVCSDQEEFEKLVEEARTFKPETGSS